jgi:hypothetical protein
MAALDAGGKALERNAGVLQRLRHLGTAHVALCQPVGAVGEITPSSIRRSMYPRSTPDRLAASAREYSATRLGYWPAGSGAAGVPAPVPATEESEDQLGARRLRYQQTASVLCGLVVHAAWGSFNVVEGLVDHYLLNLHHVRPGPNQAAYDLAFLIFGGLLAVGGFAWYKRTTASARAQLARASSTVKTAVIARREAPSLHGPVS